MKRLIGISFASCLVSFSLQAQAMEYNLKKARYVLGLDVGLSTTNSLNASDSFNVGYSTFSYNPNQTNINPYRFGISIKKNNNLSSNIFLQTGLSYHTLSSISVSGVLKQGISPSLYPFNYNYSVNNQTVLAEAKLIHQWHNVLYPYLTAGIGAAFNAVDNFTTNVPGYLTVTPSFFDTSNTSFSYVLGFGVDVIKYHPLSIGLGYRFSDLGLVGLGSAQIRNKYIKNPINPQHVYLNTVLLELNCFF